MKNYRDKFSIFSWKKSIILLSSLLLVDHTLVAQGGGAENMCKTDNPAIKVKFETIPSNATVGTNNQFGLNVFAIENTDCIDTTYNGSVTISKYAGSGNVVGNLTVNFNKGVALFDPISFDLADQYRLMASSSGLLNDTTDFITIADGAGGPNGGNNGINCETDEIVAGLQFDMFPNSSPSNTSFDIDVLAVSQSKCLDTNFVGSVSISKLNGPGNLVGTLTMTANRGVAHFTGLSIDTDGIYDIVTTDGSLVNDTIFDLNITSSGTVGGTGGSGGGTDGNCPPTSSEGERENLGLYGGSTLDLTYSNTTNRLFGAVSSPASLYYSEDDASTWHRAFPDDSLEYGCGKGWGGRALKVLTNNVGWVAVQTSQEAGTLNALVVSYDNGDTATWQTAMDGKVMQSLGYNGMFNVSGMGLSDYYMYCLMNTHVVRVHNTGAVNTSSDVIDMTTQYGNNARVTSVAVANDPSGYPIYMVVDTSSNYGMSTSGILVKYDGTSFSELTLPGTATGAASIFTHPAQVTGDTLILNAAGSTPGILNFRSFDGGANWTDISSSGQIEDVDYSPNWTSTMASSNGCVLIIPGNAISYDLGDNWQTFQLQNDGGAVHPSDPSIVLGTMGRGVVKSTTGGIDGSYAITDNYGLEAVTIKKIARTANKSIFYLATKAGLAYTTAYLDTTIVGFDKWHGANGEFPVANVGDDAGVFSVAIDPNDSAHVIVGYSNGFAVTTTGVTGFSNVQPVGWSNSTDPRANDITFVNSNVAVAVTGGENQMAIGQGNIWRTDDGGATWTNVSPSGFSSGNAVAMGANSTDTVLYAGSGLYSGTQENGSLWKSTDKGLTWTKINVGPTSTSNSSVIEMPIYDIAVDPRGTDTLYIASGSNLDNAFVVSTDGGLTYTYIDAFGEGAFTSVAINGSNPDTVYTAIRRDILSYDFANDSVSYIYRGLPGELVPDLAFGSVLAGTSMGFFRVEEDAITSTGGNNGTSGLEEVINEVNFNDVKAYPNPFTSKVNIVFSLESSDNVMVKVFDISGKEVSVITNKDYSEGNHIIEFDGSSLKEGTYMVRLISSNSVMTKNLVKLN